MILFLCICDAMLCLANLNLKQKRRGGVGLVSTVNAP